MAHAKKYEPKPLYRKVNTTTRGVKGRLHRRLDGGIKHERGVFTNDKLKYKMKTGQQFHGLDFSPLYGFLRKNTGRSWDEVKSEALKRLPKENYQDPFIGVVIEYDDYIDNKEKYDAYPAVCDFEASYHSLLYVDEDGILQYIDKTFTIDDVVLTCGCCTHSFNGKPIKRKYIYKVHTG